MVPVAATVLGIAPRMAIVTVRWSAAEAVASAATSASWYHIEENSWILPIVVAILKFRQIQRQILFAHFVIGADYSALAQRPETINVRRMDVPAHIFAGAMPDELVRIRRGQILVAVSLIGRDQINFVADHLAHEAIQSRFISVLDHLANHVALAGNRADHRNFIDRALGVRALLAAMFVLEFAAHVRLINLDRAEQLRKPVILHCGANPHHHVPRRAIVARFDLSVNLKRANSLLALRHQVDHLKPRRERVIGVLENSFRDNAESVAVALAAINVLANPMERAR